MTNYRRNFARGGTYFFAGDSRRPPPEPVDRPHRSIAQRLQIHARAASVCDRRNRRSSRTPACDLDSSRWRRRLRDAVASDQINVLARVADWRDGVAKPGREGRARHLATPLLGAYGARRDRLRATCRLYSLQSRQAWSRGVREGLAILVISSGGTARRLSGGLGRRHKGAPDRKRG